MWSLSLEYKNRTNCYVSVLTLHISHTGTRYHQRENVYWQDSIVCVKPVSGQTSILLSFLLFCLIAASILLTQMLLLNRSQFLKNPFTIHTAYAFPPCGRLFLVTSACNVDVFVCLHFSWNTRSKQEHRWPTEYSSLLLLSLRLDSVWCDWEENDLKESLKAKRVCEHTSCSPSFYPFNATYHTLKSRLFYHDIYFTLPE